MKFKVVGNKNNYTIECKDLYDAWKCAIMETKYNFSGNTAVRTIKPL